MQRFGTAERVAEHLLLTCPAIAIIVESDVPPSAS
jgi:hypothetical protein